MRQQVDEFGSPELLQPLLGRLGVGDGHAVPVDEAGRVALGRHPQRHDRALAERDREQGRTALPVHATSSTWPRRSSRPRGCPSRRCVNGVQQAPIEGTSMLYTLRRPRRPGTARPAVLRDVRQPRHLPQRLERGHQAQDPWLLVGPDASRSTTTCGSCTTASTRLDPGPRPRRRAPERLAKLQRLWLIEAARYNVLPIDDRAASGSTRPSPAARR